MLFRSALYGAVGEFAHEERQARAFGLFYTMTTAANAIAPLAVGALGAALGPGAGATAVAGLVALSVPLALRLPMRDGPAGKR